MGENQENLNYHFYDTLPRDLKSLVDKYITSYISNPDKNSEFSQELGNFSYVFKIPIINEMLISKILNKYISKKNYNLLTAVENGKPVGFIAYQIANSEEFPDSKSCYIFKSYVNPEKKDSELKTSMLDELIKRNEQEGVFIYKDKKTSEEETFPEDYRQKRELKKRDKDYFVSKFLNKREDRLLTAYLDAYC